MSVDLRLELVVRDPVADVTYSDRKQLAPRRPSLNGLTIGILSCSTAKSCDLDRLPELIAAQYPDATLLYRTKQYATQVTPPELLREFAENCQVVIGGNGQ